MDGFRIAKSQDTTTCSDFSESIDDCGDPLEALFNGSTGSEDVNVKVDRDDIANLDDFFQKVGF